MSDFRCVTADVRLGDNVYLSRFINLYGCTIGDNTRIGAFVEIQKRHWEELQDLEPPSSVKVEIEDDVVGHNVAFINDSYPRATTDGRIRGSRLEGGNDSRAARASDRLGRWTILSNLTIGENAIVGAGASSPMTPRQCHRCRIRPDPAVRGNREDR